MEGSGGGGGVGGPREKERDGKGSPRREKLADRQKTALIAALAKLAIFSPSVPQAKFLSQLKSQLSKYFRTVVEAVEL